MSNKCLLGRAKKNRLKSRLKTFKKSLNDIKDGALRGAPAKGGRFDVAHRPELNRSLSLSKGACRRELVEARPELVEG